MNNRSPLYILDGKEASVKIISDLDPDEIKYMEVLKGDKAVEKHGEKAKHGAVYIYTKVKPNSVSEQQEIRVVENKDGAYTNVEVLPEFPGGHSAFTKFISSNLKYPKEAKDNKIEGRVIVNFIIERDGALSNIKILRGIGYGCDEEASRVMNLSPKWNPGKQNGKDVRVSYSIPIFFSLDNDSKDYGLSSNKSKEEMILSSPKTDSGVKRRSENDGPKSIDQLVKIENRIILRITDDANSKSHPLIILDDKEITEEEMKQILPADIESINVLKDKDTEKYGKKGKDGVIIIKLKKKN